ncbi:hypothetical protein [Spongiibacter tropicus]|uniref:hypothetical protein n=1 Tax=Spongiibacter tropicus TaxID=454602 RepID=UPI0003B6734C|nr:hypothetical protein [Spongiibacter tropicus]
MQTQQLDETIEHLNKALNAFEPIASPTLPQAMKLHTQMLKMLLDLQKLKAQLPPS